MKVYQFINSYKRIWKMVFDKVKLDFKFNNKKTMKRYR